MAKLLKILCRGVPWGVMGCDRGVIWLIYMHFGAVECQKLLILVPWGVQIVNVNLKDTFDGKTTFIWCRGVSWSHMVNIHTFWCRRVSLIINFVAHGVFKLLMSI